MSSLAEVQGALATAQAATNGDSLSVKEAIAAIATKLNATNDGVHASLSAIRGAFDSLLDSMTASGFEIAPSLASNVQAIVIPDFDADAEEPAQG